MLYLNVYSKFETKKRLDLAKLISQPLEGIVKGIILGGSMGFGQNFSVTAKSDIDTVVICDKDKIDKLLQTDYFKTHSEQEVIDLFKKGTINFFWVTREINDIEVNAFVYETKGYVDFCLLKGNLTGYVHNKPSEIQIGWGFSGEQLDVKRNVRDFNSGFLYEKPALANGKYWGRVPNQDFFYSGHIIYEEDSFLSQLERDVWRTTIQKLKEECGENPDLDKCNVLNTHWSYHKARGRLPDSVIQNIKRRTEQELGRGPLEN